jgi:hypothetical protein
MTVIQTGAASTQRGLTAALVRGVAAKADWVRTGEVVPFAALAEAWGLPLPEVESALARGELFAVGIDGSRYVPREFLLLDATTVAAVCSALRGLDLTEELIFWKRRHGSLAGTTVLVALQADPEQGLRRVTQLARAHVAEAVHEK